MSEFLCRCDETTEIFKELCMQIHPIDEIEELKKIFSKISSVYNDNSDELRKILSRNTI